MTIKSLHVALRAYRQFLSLNTPGSAWASNRKSMIGTLIRHSTDSALTSLGLSSCRELIDYWRQRPELDSGQRASKNYSRHCIQELVRFFDWLDNADQSDWRIPQGFHRLDRRIRWLDSDGRVTRPESYSVSELVLLNAHANDRQRLLLYLSLNTGQGFSVLGRLKLTDFRFDGETRLSNALVFKFPMTNKHLDVVLWPETRAIVNRAIENAREVGATHLFHTASGDSICGQSLNRSTARLHNVHHRLTQCVKSKHPEFIRRPHKALRRFVSDLLRVNFGDEAASFYLGHHRPFRYDYGNELPPNYERNMSLVRDSLAAVFAAQCGCNCSAKRASGEGAAVTEGQQVT